MAELADSEHGPSGPREHEEARDYVMSLLAAQPLNNAASAAFEPLDGTHFDEHSTLRE
jgi:hypothetical protein